MFCGCVQVTEKRQRRQVRSGRREESSRIYSTDFHPEDGEFTNAGNFSTQSQLRQFPLVNWLRS